MNTFNTYKNFKNQILYQTNIYENQEQQASYSIKLNSRILTYWL
jgi:hypothetical protein